MEHPMDALRTLLLAAAVSAGVGLPTAERANAFELAGAWATSADQCAKVFSRKGRASQVGFSTFSGVYGGGFIAEANRLRGKAEICKIKSKNESDKIINLIVSCASGIMVSDVQFFLKIVDDNTISRAFPGMDEMEVKYHRCQI